MIFDYPTERFNFRKLLVEIFRYRKLPYRLERLKMDVDVFSRENDQSTPWHKAFYEDFNYEGFNYHGFTSLRSAYLAFLSEIIEPRFGERIVYQKIPTFRVALQHNVAVGEWHRDTDYGHGEEEINFWVPFTKAFGTNTVWIAENGSVGVPQELKYGQVLQFSGKHIHGNKVNDSGHTRVSMDFRVVPISQYKDSERTSINTKMPFKIGGYWEVLDSYGR